MINHADKNKIGSNDAIHIAFVLAQQPQMTMITFDKPMKLDIPMIFPRDIEKPIQDKPLNQNELAQRAHTCHHQRLWKHAQS